MNTAGHWQELKKEAADNDILFAYQDPVVNEASCVCPENVCRVCVINVSGEVGPCVFTNPVLSGSFDNAADKGVSSIFKNELIPLETFSFGNIENTCLAKIWQSEKYREFRFLFDHENGLSPREMLAEIPPSCKTCYKRLVSS